MTWIYNQTSRLYQLQTERDWLHVDFNLPIAGCTRDGTTVGSFESFSDSASLALPPLEQGVQVSVVYSEKPWTYSHILNYDSSVHKVYSFASRWKTTKEGMNFERDLEGLSLAHFLINRVHFSSTPGLPENKRTLVLALLDML